MTRQTYQSPAVSEVYAVCFSIYGTLGEPHLALDSLSMSSLMYSHLSTGLRGCAVRPATGVRLQGKVCVSLSGS